ncbi:hypothetical protein R6Q59_000153 [Mikania micrantha]
MSPETKNLAIIALFATILFLNFQENEAMRLLDGEFEETWMKRGNLLLSSLQQHSSVPSPGNGCNNTGNGGNNCIGSKKVTGRRHGDGARPHPTLIHSTSVDH